MDTIVIGKPAINTYLELQEFPKEGDVFTIKAPTESVGNVGATSACLLAKWGIPTHYTGVVGNDDNAEKIRNTFLKYKVDVKFIETDFTKKTCINYIILNKKDGLNSKIISNDPDMQLQKYKYDFIPEWAIMDGTEIAGSLAYLNNNPNSKTVYYGRIADKDSIAFSKRCSYVICTQIFAETLCHEGCDGSAQSCVNLYQKVVDTSGNSNFIIILNNHKILYADEGQVKLLPATKLNNVDISSFDSIFTGAFTFAMELNSNLNDAIKFANMAASMSLSKVGDETSIPELSEVLENSGLRDRINVLNVQKQETVTVDNNQIGGLSNSVQEVQSVNEFVNNQPVNQDAFNQVMSSQMVDNVNTMQQIQTQPAQQSMMQPQMMEQPIQPQMMQQPIQPQMMQQPIQPQMMQQPVQPQMTVPQEIMMQQSVQQPVEVQQQMVQPQVAPQTTMIDQSYEESNMFDA